MARTALSPEQKQRIVQAKQLLRSLWRQSGLMQQELLAALAARGFSLRKNTLSNWLSETDLKRPDRDCLLSLIEILNPHQPVIARQLHYELEHLFGYETAPESSDEVLNQLASRLQPGSGSSSLIERLGELEERIFVYDRSYPVLRIEADDRAQLRELLGKDRAGWARYRVSSGYEIPLSQVRVPRLLTGIIDDLHEGAMALRTLLEQDLLGQASRAEYPLFDELHAYIWEIVNRLLYNPCCRDHAPMHNALLSIVGACQGMRYLLASEHGQPSLVAYENVLQQKGMASRAQVRCSLAVYVGVLARHLLVKSRDGEAAVLARGLRHCDEAIGMLTSSHLQLDDKRASYYYKKELANLCYDAATLLLWLPGQQARSRALMARAHRYYDEVLGSDNLFRAGLSRQRKAYLQVFRTISEAWCSPQPEALLARFERLEDAPGPDEGAWLERLAAAIACGILYVRNEGPDRERCLQSALRALRQAGRIPGMQPVLARELQQDYILSQLSALLPRLDEALARLDPQSAGAPLRQSAA